MIATLALSRIPFLVSRSRAALTRGALISTAGLLLAFDATAHLTAEWANTAMRALAPYLDSSPDLPPKLLVSERAYGPAYINPGETGLRYRRFNKRPIGKPRISFPPGKRPLHYPDGRVILNA